MTEREKKHHFVKGEKPGTFKKISLVVLLIFGLRYALGAVIESINYGEIYFGIILGLILSSMLVGVFLLFWFNMRIKF